jgi:hypothetical protein
MDVYHLLINELSTKSMSELFTYEVDVIERETKLHGIKNLVTT